MLINEHDKENPFLYCRCTECHKDNVDKIITLGIKQRTSIYLCDTCFSRLLYRMQNTLIREALNNEEDD